jgi:hypothetical protein
MRYFLCFAPFSYLFSFEIRRFTIEDVNRLYAQFQQAYRTVQNAGQVRSNMLSGIHKGRSVLLAYGGKKLIKRIQGVYGYDFSFQV